MKIFSKEAIYKAEKATIERQKITSDELMERAAKAIFQWLAPQLKSSEIPIYIFCGIGNNGGDGLALGRMLIDKGHPVSCYIVNYSNKRSECFLLNYDRYKNTTKNWPVLLNPEGYKKSDDFPKLQSNAIIIDAIFGIGLNRPLSGWLKTLVQHINNANALVLSVDIPSGLFLDKHSPDKKAIIKATYTVSFQIPKLIFFLPETSSFVGQVQLLDIGFDHTFLQETPTNTTLINREEARNLYRGRSKFSHKGTYGHCLVAGGSYGKMGSVILATQGALCIGAGKVTSLIPKCGYTILQTSIPEAMTITADEENFLIPTKIGFTPQAICFGIGVGTNKTSTDFLKKLLEENNTPFVIDADGINLLSKQNELLKMLPKKSILTPHPKELERLIGQWKNDFEKLEMAKAFSEKYKLILVIKGAHTTTVANNQLYINTTGNPGMATAGSGDVLAGIIAGLLAQGYDPAIAAVFGVYLHGSAGDSAAKKLGYEALLASHLIEYIPQAYASLFKENTSPKKENK